VDAKICLGKLSDVQQRVDALMSKMVVPHILQFGALFEKGSVLESAEKDIRQFADALVELIRLTRVQQMEPNIARTVKNLGRSQTFNEITTLMGLTVLGEYRERLERRAQVMKLWKERIQPQLHKVISLADLGNELTNLSERVRDLLNYDTNTREDDVVRMILAIQDQNFEGFNAICEKVQQRLTIEERTK
jgi:hypothetical protein